MMRNEQRNSPGVTTTISGLINPHRSYDSWRATRPTFVGASESPTLFGVGYSSQSPTTLALSKLGLETESDREESEAMRWGTRLQDAIGEEFGERVGLDVKSLGPFTVVRSAQKPYIAATLDGYVDEPALGVVELKNVGAYNARDWDGDEPPLRVNVQVQHQMFCVGPGCGIAYVVGLIGGNQLSWKVVERHDRFIAALVQRIDDFWGDIHAGKMPPIDGSEATSAALKSLYRATNGESIALPHECELWDEKLQQAKAAIKVQEELKSEMENRIRAALGAAEMGVLPNGVMYVSPVTIVNHKAKEAFTSQFRALRRKAAHGRQS